VRRLRPLSQTFIVGFQLSNSLKNSFFIELSSPIICFSILLYSKSFRGIFLKATNYVLLEDKETNIIQQHPLPPTNKMSSNQQRPQGVVTHQPVQNLTPEEMEQLEGMKKWERIRKERRAAAGIPVEGTYLQRD
jgi:hypothetical protein